jgi:hypothetical protein
MRKAIGLYEDELKMYNNQMYFNDNTMRDHLNNGRVGNVTTENLYIGRMIEKSDNFRQTLKTIDNLISNFKHERNYNEKQLMVCS